MVKVLDGLKRQGLVIDLGIIFSDIRGIEANVNMVLMGSTPALLMSITKVFHGTPGSLWSRIAYQGPEFTEDHTWNEEILKTSAKYHSKV